MRVTISTDREEPLNWLELNRERFNDRSEALHYLRDVRRQIDALWPAPKKPKPYKLAESDHATLKTYQDEEALKYDDARAQAFLDGKSLL